MPPPLVLPALNALTHRPRSVPWMGTVGLLVVLVGCGAGESDGRSDAPVGFSQHDSAGVLISVTRGEQARSEVGWVVDSVPDLVIGEEEAPSELFHEIGGVAELEDGTVVVVDGASGEIRFFGPDGRLVTRMGGKGEGPGEFQDPSLVPTLGADSLLVYDGALRRFHLVSMDGQAFRVLRVDGWPTAGPPVGALGSWVLVDAGFGRPPSGSVWEVRHTLSWIHLGDHSEVSLATFMISLAYFTGERSARAIPFLNPRPASAVTPSGALISHHAPEVREYGTDGGLRRILRVKGLSRPITSSVIDSMAGIQAERLPGTVTRSSYRQILSEMPLPGTMPAFTSLRLDESGGFWAALYDMDDTGPTRWMVFDEDGRALGTLETPARLAVHEIGAGSVLGVWTSDLGVQQVRRYQLQRGAEGG